MTNNPPKNDPYVTLNVYHVTQKWMRYHYGDDELRRLAEDIQVKDRVKSFNVECGQMLKKHSLNDFIKGLTEEDYDEVWFDGASRIINDSMTIAVVLFKKRTRKETIQETAKRLMEYHVHIIQKKYRDYKKQQHEAEWNEYVKWFDEITRTTEFVL